MVAGENVGLHAIMEMVGVTVHPNGHVPDKLVALKMLLASMMLAEH